MNSVCRQCCQPAISHALGNTFLKTEHPMGTIDAWGGQLGGRVAQTSSVMTPAEAELLLHGSSRRALNYREWGESPAIFSLWCWSDILSRKMAKNKILSSRMTSVKHLKKKFECSSVMKRNCIFLMTSRKLIQWQLRQVSSQPEAYLLGSHLPWWL